METPKTKNKAYYKGLIEAILFIESEAIPVKRLSELLDMEIKEVRALINELKETYEKHSSGLQINEYANTLKLSTSIRYADFLKGYYKSRHQQKFSKTSMETLAIIAYKQPIIKSEIEDIRGVSCDNAIKDLMEKRLIKVMGRRKVPGNPMEYGTTKEFLEYFGLKSTKELPTLKEIKELSFE
ncbi:MAG: SMC-Scp complex subunit ScpB [Spirochaetes bacterium]|nr:SMC-Scp complex subunit ScpB [Spirochaetota bacterium]